MAKMTEIQAGQTLLVVKEGATYFPAERKQYAAAERVHVADVETTKWSTGATRYRVVTVEHGPLGWRAGTCTYPTA